MLKERMEFKQNLKRCNGIQIKQNEYIYVPRDLVVMDVKDGMGATGTRSRYPV
jgi:hypothetical protein